MAKVIVERPRHGSRMRGPGKGKRRAWKRIALDEQPRREGIKRSIGVHTKFLNEHLGPLRRYLLKQVGRPWDKVFSEICAHVSRNNPVQDHVRDHVEGYVATKVLEIEGELYWIGWAGMPVPLMRSHYQPLMYVCPRTGILKLVKGRRSRRKRRAEKSAEVRVYRDPLTAFIRFQGVWRFVEFEAFPHPQHANHPLPILHDALYDRKFMRIEAAVWHGRPIIAMKVRPATPDEIRRYCLPLKSPNIVR